MKKLLAALLAALLSLSATGCAQDAPAPTEPTEPPAPGAPDPYVRLQRHVTFYDVQGLSHILIDGTVHPTTLEGISSVKQSLDGSRTALFTRDGDAYLLTADQLTQVAENVTSPYMSVSGDALAYFVASGDGYALKRYDCATGTAATVTTDTVRTLVLSPDGHTLAYVTADGQLMYYDGTETAPLPAAPDTLLGMDDSGRIYGATLDEEGYHLSCYTVSETRDLGPMDGPAVYFDRDHDQLLFYRDGDSYISTGGEAPLESCPGTATALLPPGTASFSNGAVTTWPVTDLYGLVYASKDDGTPKLWLLDQGSQPHLLADHATFPTLDSTGEYLYYLLDETKLCCLRLSDGTETAYAKGVQSYAVTSDRKTLYLTSGTKLYRMDGIRGGDPVEIFDDTIDLLHLTLTADDTLYFRSRDTLYAYSGGETATQQLPRCQQLTTTPNGILYAYGPTGLHTHGLTGLTNII